VEVIMKVIFQKMNLRGREITHNFYLMDRKSFLLEISNRERLMDLVKHIIQQIILLILGSSYKASSKAKEN